MKLKKKKVKKLLNPGSKDSHRLSLLQGFPLCDHGNHNRQVWRPGRLVHLSMTIICEICLSMWLNLNSIFWRFLKFFFCFMNFIFEKLLLPFRYATGSKYDKKGIGHFRSTLAWGVVFVSYCLTITCFTIWLFMMDLNT